MKRTPFAGLLAGAIACAPMSALPVEVVPTDEGGVIFKLDASERAYCKEGGGCTIATKREIEEAAAMVIERSYAAGIAVGRRQCTGV